jgi:hypothetical protein
MGVAAPVGTLVGEAEGDSLPDGNGEKLSSIEADGDASVLGSAANAVSGANR